MSKLTVTFMSTTDGADNVYAHLLSVSARRRTDDSSGELPNALFEITKPAELVDNGETVFGGRVLNSWTKLPQVVITASNCSS